MPPHTPPRFAPRSPSPTASLPSKYRTVELTVKHTAERADSGLLVSGYQVGTWPHRGTVLLTPGNTYIFNLTDSSNMHNPFFLSKTQDGRFEGSLEFNRTVEYHFGGIQINTSTWVKSFTVEATASHTRTLTLTLPLGTGGLGTETPLYYYSLSNPERGGVMMMNSTETTDYTQVRPFVVGTRDGEEG